MKKQISIELSLNIYMITLNYYKVNKKVDNAIVLFEELLIRDLEEKLLQTIYLIHLYCISVPYLPPHPS